MLFVLPMSTAIIVFLLVVLPLACIIGACNAFMSFVEHTINKL